MVTHPALRLLILLALIGVMVWLLAYYLPLPAPFGTLIVVVGVVVAVVIVGQFLLGGRNGNSGSPV